MAPVRLTIKSIDIVKEKLAEGEVLMIGRVKATFNFSFKMLTCDALCQWQIENDF